MFFLLSLSFEWTDGPCWGLGLCGPLRPWMWIANLSSGPQWLFNRISAGLSGFDFSPVPSEGFQSLPAMATLQPL